MVHDPLPVIALNPAIPVPLKVFFRIVTSSDIELFDSTEKRGGFQLRLGIYVIEREVKVSVQRQGRSIYREEEGKSTYITLTRRSGIRVRFRRNPPLGRKPGA